MNTASKVLAKPVFNEHQQYFCSNTSDFRNKINCAAAKTDFHGMKKQSQFTQTEQWSNGLECHCRRKILFMFNSSAFDREKKKKHWKIEEISLCFDKIELEIVL